MIWEFIRAFTYLVVSILLLIFAYRLYIKNKFLKLMEIIETNGRGLYHLYEQKFELVIAKLKSVEVYVDVEELEEVLKMIKDLGDNEYQLDKIRDKLNKLDEEVEKVINNHPELERNNKIKEFQIAVININEEISDLNETYVNNINKYNKKVNGVISKFVAKHYNYQQL